jgi:hypothetical protein
MADQPRGRCFLAYSWLIPNLFLTEGMKNKIDQIANVLMRRLAGMVGYVRKRSFYLPSYTEVFDASPCPKSQNHQPNQYADYHIAALLPARICIHFSSPYSPSRCLAKLAKRQPASIHLIPLNFTLGK